MNRMKSLILFLLAVTLVHADDASSNQRRNLPDRPAKPRFVLTDRDWPAKEGGASICLWKDDGFAAFTLGIDDNQAGNVPWWMDEAKKYGIRPTWFIITSIVSDDPKKISQGGNWDLWRKVYADGFGVDSHSVTHGDGWKGADAEYAESQAAIQKNIPGDKCLTIAFPGSPTCINDPAVAAKYYIAGRGGRPVHNPPNQINYPEINATSAGIVIDSPADWAGSVNKLFDPKPKNPSWRGWFFGFYHYIKPGPEAATERDELEKKFAFIQGKVATNDLWQGLFDEVAQYGQERDTAKLDAKAESADKITLTLTDEMDDKLFDFPLTVKVHVGDWKSAKATQEGKEVGCKLVDHEGAKFALVQVMPDRGPVTLTP